MIQRAGVWGPWALTTAAWTLWLPFYYRFPVWWGALLIGAAGLLAAVSDRDAASSERPGLFATLLTFPATAAAFLFLPRGIGISLVTLLLGLVLLQWGRNARPIGKGLRLIGTLAVVQGIVVSVYDWAFASAHSSAFVSFFDHWIGQALGLDVSAVGRTLYVSLGGETILVTPSWDQFGLVYVVLIAFGWLLYGWLRGGLRASIGKSASVIGGVVAYAIVRHVGILVLAIEIGNPDLFWSPAITILSFLPLLAFLAALSPVPGGRSAASKGARKGGKTSWATGALVLIGAASLCVGLYMQPPGGVETGRILFDEAHGDWESTLRPMDTEWYGMPSTYNYDSLFQWLSYYYEVGRITGSFADGSLKSADVLVLKTPSIPYTEEEIRVVAAHVRSGGGLFVIGDHTNVFGTTSVLNPILARFGAELNYDATYDLRDGSFTIYRPAPFTLDPVMQGVERFEYLTSCTMNAPLGAYSVMRDGGIITNQADYATRDFFAPERFALSSTFGVFVQAAAIPYGRGRVVVFTDSTCFSNFSVHMDGYPAFLLGVMAYLQTGSAAFPARAAAIALCGLCLAGALVLFHRLRYPALLATLLVAGVAGWCAGSAMVAGLHSRWYATPRPIGPIPYAYFDLADSEVSISPQPPRPGSVAERDRFDTFFVWTQRVGLVPVPLEEDPTSDLVAGRPYVLINPTAGLEDRTCSGIAEYVREDGGTLILLGRPDTDRASLDRLLVFLDLGIEEGPGGTLVLGGANVAEHEISPAMTLHVSRAKHGKGRVILIGDSAALADLSFGGTFTIPSDVQRRLYDVAFQVLIEADGADQAP